MYDLNCVVASVRAARQPVMLEYLDGNLVYFHDQYLRYELNLLHGVAIPISKEQFSQLDFRRECFKLEEEANPVKLSSTQSERVFATKPMNQSMVYLYHQFESGKVQDLKHIKDWSTYAFVTTVASQQVKADDLLKALKLSWTNVPIGKVTQIYTGGYALWSPEDELLSVENVVDMLQQQLS